MRALEEHPELWASYSTGENMLFQAGDFYDPAASPLFGELKQIDPIRPLVDALERSCYVEVASVPSLHEVLRGAVLPSHRVRRPRRGEVERGEDRTRFEVAFLPVVGVGAALLALVAAAGAARIAAVLAVIAIASVVVPSMRAYRRQPVVRRRERTARESSVLARWISELQNERRALDRERQDFLARIDAMRDERLAELQDAALDRHLRHHFVNELDAVEGVGHRAVVRMKAVGIRTAFHATPERVAEAKGLTSESRARIGAWRDELAAEAAADVPDTLSPAEVQRMNRLIERRLSGLDAQAARLDAKIEVQRGELARVQAQYQAIPNVSLRQYVLYLLRLRTLPRMHVPPVSAPLLQRATLPPTESKRESGRAAGAWWEEV